VRRDKDEKEKLGPREDELKSHSSTSLKSKTQGNKGKGKKKIPELSRFKHTEKKKSTPTKHNKRKQKLEGRHRFLC